MWFEYNLGLLFTTVSKEAQICTSKTEYFTNSRAAKTILCAQNVKTVRLCTEFNKSINKIFRYATYCGISKMVAIDFESFTWVKN